MFVLDTDGFFERLDRAADGSLCRPPRRSDQHLAGQLRRLGDETFSGSLPRRLFLRTLLPGALLFSGLSFG